MEKTTDWLKLWDQLAGLNIKIRKHGKDRCGNDPWKHSARHFDQSVAEKWKHPDSSRNYIKSVLKKNPGSTLLDIGAGTGSWSLYLSPYAKSITALDPSDSMLHVMKEKLAGSFINNIKITKGGWLDANVRPHDYLLASHSFYGIRDFSACIKKMNDTARKSCFLVLRVLLSGTPMAKAAARVLGQPYDSTNFQVAYNALLQMGIYPNVLMETIKPGHVWTSNSPGDALNDIKRRLGIPGTSEHDAYLKKLLKDSLTEREGKYVWPAGVRSALVYWDV